MRCRRCDPSAFFDAIGRDPGALASMLDLFQAEGGKQCARIVGAARSRARRPLREALHALSGSLALVRAQPALGLCESLRALCAKEDAALDPVAHDLAREFELVCDELASLVAELGRAAA